MGVEKLVRLFVGLCCTQLGVIEHGNDTSFSLLDTSIRTLRRRGGVRTAQNELKR
jgi:hypothetical protein